MWRHIAANALTFFIVALFLVAGLVTWGISEYIAEKEARHMDTFIHYGLAAACQAVVDSGLPVSAVAAAVGASN